LRTPRASKTTPVDTGGGEMVELMGRRENSRRSAPHNVLNESRMTTDVAILP
jgi:hypothetical protein